MSLISDKTSIIVRDVLLPVEFGDFIRGQKSTLGDLVVSYLPKAFETLTRGINNGSLRSKIVEALPFFSKTTISDEVCSYLDNRRTMLGILDELPVSDACISHLMKLVEREAWTDLLVEPDVMDQYLLEAVRRGLLTQYEFSSLSLLFMARKTAKRNPVVLPFVDGDKINPVAEKLIKESFILKKVEGVINQPGPLLTEEQFEKFVRELRKFPRTEQMVYLIPFTGERTILPAINRLGLNLFGKVTFSHTINSSVFGYPIVAKLPHSMMVAPLGMVQAFLNVKFGDNAVELLPAMGPIPFIAELRENGLNGTRVVGIDNSILNLLTGLTFPTQADGFDAPGVYFSFHDACYHGYLSSSVPHSLRQRFVSFFDFTKEKRPMLIEDTESSAEKDLFFRKLGFQFPDMEHTLFRPEIATACFKEKQNPLCIFWDSCAQNIQAATKNGLSIVADSVRKWRKALQDHGMMGKEDLDAIRSEITRMSARTGEDLLPVLQLML